MPIKDGKSHGKVEKRLKRLVRLWKVLVKSLRAAEGVR